MADKRENRGGESRAQPNQRIPSNWDSDGRSQGESTGCVRKTPDAYQGPRSEGESTPAKPAN